MTKHDRRPLPRALEIFVALAGNSSMFAASIDAGCSPQTVTHAIRRLEQQLGVLLVERTSTGSTLTAEGKAVLVRARDVLAAYERLLAE